MGVEMVDSSSRQKATKNNMDKGVAGRSMVGYRCAGCAESRRAHETGSEVVVVVVSERLSWALRSSWAGRQAGRQAGLLELRRRGQCCELGGVENGPYARCGSVKRVTTGVGQGDACVRLFYHIELKHGRWSATTWAATIWQRARSGSAGWRCGGWQLRAGKWAQRGKRRESKSKSSNSWGAARIHGWSAN